MKPFNEEGRLREFIYNNFNYLAHYEQNIFQKTETIKVFSLNKLIDFSNLILAFPHLELGFDYREFVCYPNNLPIAPITDTTKSRFGTEF